MIPVLEVTCRRNVEQVRLGQEARRPEGRGHDQDGEDAERAEAMQEGAKIETPAARRLGFCDRRHR
jgi:hypothetical protein